MKISLLISFSLLFYSNFCYPFSRQKQHWKTTFEYYENGTLKSKCKHERFWRLKTCTYYDSLGKKTTKGKYFNNLQHRKWKEYKNGKTVKKTQYRFGVNSKKLLNNKGNNLTLILTYGVTGGRMGICDDAKNNYGFTYKSIGGCVLLPNTTSRLKLHNFLANFHLIIQNGFNWKDKADDKCKKSTVRIKL